MRRELAKRYIEKETGETVFFKANLSRIEADLKHTSRFAFIRDTCRCRDIPIFRINLREKYYLVSWLRKCVPANIAELLNMTATAVAAATVAVAAAAAAGWLLGNYGRSPASQRYHVLRWPL